MISIILWMWGFEGPKGRYHGLYNYCPAMTNSLAAQIRRNVSIPHEIVVVSDFPADQFDPSIRYVSLQRHFGELRHMGGCYLRLKAFSAEMHDVLGPRCFWLDTDSVVVGSLDPLLCRKEPVVLLKLDTVPSTPFNGSCALVWSVTTSGVMPRAASSANTSAALPSRPTDSGRPVARAASSRPRASSSVSARASR